MIFGLGEIWAILPSLSKIRKFKSEIYGCALNFTQICRYTFKFKGAAMDVKLNINLNSNLMSVGKISAAASAANLNAGALNLKSGDRGDILRGASDSLSGASNLPSGESSADILKKQLEKLQKRLKELEAAIKRVKASKNPYAKDMAASLETQKGAVFAQIMQISARILEMQGGQSKI
ncbi:MAG: hypothetical protein ACFNTA_02035 [Campylobacter sp.]|uniref:hypothetical protein n=1 Tax=Campylobacter sp. TaxID=205 RepID=UPI00361D017B